MVQLKGERKKQTSIAAVPPRMAPPRSSRSGTVVSFRDASPSQLRLLASSIDDCMMRMAEEHGISSDLLRRYYVNQCTTVSRPSFFHNTTQGITHTQTPLPPSITTSPKGLTLPKPLSPIKLAPTTAYSCDIEAALNGAISDEDQDIDRKDSLTPVHTDHQRSPERLDTGRNESIPTPDYAREYAFQADLGYDSKLVEVSHIVPNTNQFYVRVRGTDSTSLQDLQGKDFPLLTQARPAGIPCTVLSEMRWHRGRVEKVGLGSVTVCLVDSGVTEEYRVPPGNPSIRALPGPYSMAPLAYRCSLSKTLLAEYGRDIIQEGQAYMAHFRQLNTRRRDHGIKSWEILDIKQLRDSHQTGPGIQRVKANTDTDGRRSEETGMESSKPAGFLFQTKQVDVRNWVNKASKKLEWESKTEEKTTESQPTSITRHPTLNKCDMEEQANFKKRDF